MEHPDGIHPTTVNYSVETAVTRYLGQVTKSCFTSSNLHISTTGHTPKPRSTNSITDTVHACMTPGGATSPVLPDPDPPSRRLEEFVPFRTAQPNLAHELHEHVGLPPSLFNLFQCVTSHGSALRSPIRRKEATPLRAEWWQNERCSKARSSALLCLEPRWPSRTPDFGVFTAASTSL